METDPKVNWNNLVGMSIAGIGAIALCLHGNINGDAAVGLLGAILGYAFGYANGNKKNHKQGANS